MASTRSSARRAAAANSSPTSSEAKTTSKKPAAGNKRKSDTGSAPKSKRGKKSDGKSQKTIEETMPDEGGEEVGNDVEMKDDHDEEAQNGQGTATADEGAEGSVDKVVEDTKEEKDQAPAANEPSNEAEGETQMDDAHDAEPEATSKGGEVNSTGTGTGAKTEDANGGAVKESSQREESTPSSILEKGIIYFFFRGRVNIDEPSDVNEIARSYMVLRPLPHGAKLGDGVIGDDGNNRLLALPKKVLPTSHRDRFMVFVEKSKSSMEDIKNTFKSSDYATKTAGTRHTPAATPIAEGVYAITSTGRESHLAYILTIPSELSEVQKDVGLRERGSFVASVRNPKYEGPANTNLPKGPDYPQE